MERFEWRTGAFAWPGWDYTVPKYKNQHFIGKGIVAFFKGSTGKVVFWDKSEGNKLEPRNPKSVHSLNYLYSTWNEKGERENAGEHKLQSEIDDHAPSIIRVLLDRVSDTGEIRLRDDEKRFLVRYFLKTILRNPSVISNLVNGNPKVILAKQLIRIGRFFRRGWHHDEAYKKYGRDRVLNGEVISYAVSHNIDECVELIRQRGFQFLIPLVGARNLVLGSQPFLFNTITEGFPRLNKKDAKVTSEAYIVLHPRLLLRISEDADDCEPYQLRDEDVQKYNGLVIKYSDSIVAVNQSDIDGAWFYDFGNEESQIRSTISIS